MGAKIYVHKVKKLIFSGTETLFKAGVFAEKLTKNKITLTIPDKMMKTSFSVAMILALATGTHINSSVSLDHELFHVERVETQRAPEEERVSPAAGVETRTVTQVDHLERPAKLCRGAADGGR